MIRIGTSGWSYPSWRPGFYPADLQPPEFLGFYAQHFDTVELNSTGYRLPSEDQFRRWADAAPDGFKFAVKLPLTRLDRVTPFLERVLALGDRLGPVRIVVEAARDDGLLSFVEGSRHSVMMRNVQVSVFVSSLGFTKMAVARGPLQRRSHSNPGSVKL